MTATATDKPGVVEIASIEGDGGRLSLDPQKNCVGIAARETLALLGNCSCGVSLTLRKVCWFFQSVFVSFLLCTRLGRMSVSL